VAAQTLALAHAEEMRAYRLANNVDKACCKSIVDAFDDKFLADRADPVVIYANETALTLITHLKECYAFISSIDIVANYERMCQTYDPSRPIEDLFKQMQDGWAYAQAGQQPYEKNRSSTSHMRSFSTHACIATHARNGKSKTFWIKIGEISRHTSQLSTVCTVNRHKQPKQLSSRKSCTSPLTGRIDGGTVRSPSRASQHQCY
jgi:hypothetical protein